MKKIKRVTHILTIFLALFLALKTPISSYNMRYNIESKEAVRAAKKSLLKSAFERLKTSPLVPMTLLSLALFCEQKLYKMVLAIIAIIIYTFTIFPFKTIHINNGQKK